MPFDANEAYQYGQLVNAAYQVPPQALGQLAGQLINPAFDPLQRDYTIVTSIYGNDLVTDLLPGVGDQIVSYGFVLQDAAGNVVIAIRGTEYIREWMHDAQFLQKPCPFLAGAGMTEDGFTDVYETLSIDAALNNKLTASLAGLNFPNPVKSVTVAGHSLGAALATLLALDIAANTAFTPVVYSYASPRVGDVLFANTYNSLLPNSYRLANQLDIVTKLPLDNPPPPLPQYLHVNSIVTLNPFSRPDKVCLSARCEHIITTYLYLIAGLPGINLPAAAQVPALADYQCQLDLAIGLPSLIT